MPEVEQQTSVTSASNFQKDELLIEAGTSPSVMVYVQAASQAGMHVAAKKFKYLNSAVVNPENLSAFHRIKSNKTLTRVDLIDDTDEKVQELIFKFKTSPRISHGESIATRLLDLFHGEKGEDPLSLGISDGSLQNFYNFLISFVTLNKMKTPSISLTPENNIYASWRFEEGRLFSIHFLPGGDIRFVVFKPNERHPDRKIRVSGTATSDTIMETVGPYGVWGWILE